jgi:putative ABC transport system ATP-binding protein
VNSDSMMDLLFDYTKKSQTSLVMVTHDNSIANRCDRIIEIKDGQIV